ncbi:MAG: four helix bundle protein [Chryseobacterium sp.]|uniref:four helix bundle protein n=1 Tax=Chryseobacterium piscicola TaxID=551459 RepID=UPI001E427F83|nr:four helix bundle protein [Chryseobacterium piscicola]
MTNQIKRAVLSITNNIAEGSEYSNNTQIIRYLKHSKVTWRSKKYSKPLFDVITKKIQPI